MNTYGETIYGTRKSWMKPAEWGVAVEKKNTVYLHILYPEKLKNQLDLKNFPYKITEQPGSEQVKKLHSLATKIPAISVTASGIKTKCHRSGYNP